MIPILYEKNETAFTSNGLGRLRDCISCVVTEERNGIYECDFEYPVDGINYDRIQCGRIIAVRHDESNDVQPFDIVGYERPINGVVTFHCVHISYRQTALTVYGNNIESLADAFDLLGNSTPANPFNYWTDKSGSTGFLASADKVPHSVRQMLGGMEGSILDTYGGEYEWDKWTVKLWANRGETKNFTIRYGLNLADYKENLDFSDTYNSVIPYWTGQNKKGNDVCVKGDEVTSGSSFNDYDRCVPLDLTDKFESKPSKADLEAEALSYLQANQTHMPSQTIEVDFVRLSESSEYNQFVNLQKCRLCDSIRVVFSRYNMTGIFKIVKTEYNVLQERYNKLELGTLAATLSDAMGVGMGSSSQGFSSDLIGLSDLVISNETHNFSAVSSGGNMTWTGVTITKTGYYPIGVVGFYSGAAALLVRRCEIEDAQSGSCTLNFACRAVAAVSAGTCNVRILWVKEDE